ncbi:MAG: sigma-70 family RNA polymerase sigma factor, partial [Oscillospiraceae bacterium]
IKAVDAFDPTLGFCFSTYAVPVILGEMKRLFRDGGTVKVSRSLKELSMKITRQREMFAKKYSREPTVSELAKLTESDEEMVAEAICASLPTVSLTPQEETPTIEIPMESHEEALCDRIAIEQALYKLEKTEREIVVLRFFKYKTQTETAELLGMTQVQISRKEKKILEKLKNILK